MKSITIHNLDDQTVKLLEEEAARKELSLNKTIKLLLRRALGLKPVDEKKRKAEFMDLFGQWSDADKEEFDRNTADLGQVDPDDWK